LKPTHFVRICFVLAGMLAFGQANDRPSLNQSLAPRNVRRSQISPAGVTAPQGLKGTPALAPKSQSPQSAAFSFANAVTYDSGGFDSRCVSK